MFLFLAGIVIGIFLTKAYEWNTDECPRMIRGYNCKGDECDHSPAEVAQAKWDVHRK